MGDSWGTTMTQQFGMDPEEDSESDTSWTPDPDSSGSPESDHLWRREFYTDGKFRLPTTFAEAGTLIEVLHPLEWSPAIKAGAQMDILKRASHTQDVFKSKVWGVLAQAGYRGGRRRDKDSASVTLPETLVQAQAVAAPFLSLCNIREEIWPKVTEELQRAARDLMLKFERQVLDTAKRFYKDSVRKGYELVQLEALRADRKRKLHRLERQLSWSFKNTQEFKCRPENHVMCTLDRCEELGVPTAECFRLKRKAMWWEPPRQDPDFSYCPELHSAYVCWRDYKLLGRVGAI